MSLFSSNKRNYDIPYQDRQEFLSQFVTYTDLFLLEKLKAFVPLNSAQNEKKKEYLEWLSSRLPKDLPAKEDMKKEISARAEMSNAAGRNIGIPTMIYNVCGDDDDENPDLEKFLLIRENEKIKDLCARVLFLSACFRKDTRYEGLISLLCNREGAAFVITLGELIDICRETETHSLSTELAVCFNILNLFLLDTAIAENPLNASVFCDDRLYGAIFGNEGFIPDWLSRHEQTEETDEIKFRDELLEKLVSYNRESGVITALVGAHGAGKKTLTMLVADELERDVVTCNIGDQLISDGRNSEQAEKVFSADYREIQKRFLYARRECILTNSILLIQGLESGCEAIVFDLMNFLRSQVRTFVSNIFVAYDSEKEPTFPPFVRPVIIESLSNQQKVELWKDFLDPSLDVDDRDVEETGATFSFTPGQIKEAASRVLSYGIKNPDRKLLHKACYGVLRGNLSSKATLVESGFTWDDIKLYPKEKCLLRDICDAVENRPKVMQDWNFRSKMPYGAGITVLFAGPPGTGKTMSATVIANELGMELYKVDSSRLIDKYVGETEKNIRAIFNLASHSNAILFFDEADAIFNKRMDAKDANERFANIESSLLLQCIEEYNGVVILATNKMSAMDPAFMRRFRFYVQFAEPGEDIAYDIWTSVFPKEAPLAEGIDFKELAHVFKITGAVIKNIALQAAYQASGKGESINMIHILRAAKREMEKNHKVITREELGRLSYLYQEMMND